MRTKLATIIAHNEGFGIPGATPTVNHNPGDLRHGPHEQHPGNPNAIGVVDCDADGWADLERQLELFANRTITWDPMLEEACEPRKMNLQDLAYTYAPPADHNPTEAYLTTILVGLHLPANTPVADALTIPATA